MGVNFKHNICICVSVSIGNVVIYLPYIKFNILTLTP